MKLKFNANPEFREIHVRKLKADFSRLDHRIYEKLCPNVSKTTRVFFKFIQISTFKILKSLWWFFSFKSSFCFMKLQATIQILIGTRRKKLFSYWRCYQIETSLYFNNIYFLNKIRFVRIWNEYIINYSLYV